MQLVSFAKLKIGSAIVRILGQAGYEFRLGRRTLFFWLLLAFLVLLDFLRLLDGRDVESSTIGWYFSGELLPLTALLVVFFVAFAAHRLERDEVNEVAFARWIGSEELVVARFLGIFGLALALLVGQLLGLALLQGLIARTNLIALAYVHAFLRSVPPLFFLSALAYLLSLLGHNQIVGSLAGLYWLVIMGGAKYFPTAFNFFLSQNGPLHLLAGLFLLALTAFWYERPRRGRQSRLGGWTLALGTAALLLALVRGTVAALVTQEWPLVVSDYRRNYAETSVGVGQSVPNYAWTDHRGQRVSFATLKGQPVLLLFWSPEDKEVPSLLCRLGALRRVWAGKKLEVLAVCVSEDGNLARHFATENKLSFPLVTDLENLREPPHRNSYSPVARAFGGGGTPRGFLINAQGILTRGELPLDKDQAEELKSVLEEWLAPKEEKKSE